MYQDWHSENLVSNDLEISEGFWHLVNQVISDAMSSGCGKPLFMLTLLKIDWWRFVARLVLVMLFQVMWLLRFLNFTIPRHPILHGRPILYYVRPLLFKTCNTRVHSDRCRRLKCTLISASSMGSSCFAKRNGVADYNNVPLFYARCIRNALAL